MTKPKKQAKAKDEERCPHCGYCKHCGQAKPVAAPVPLLPLWQPYGYQCAGCGCWVYGTHICSGLTIKPYIISSGNITISPDPNMGTASNIMPPFTYTAAGGNA